MNKRLTGSGVLSRKLYTILMAAGMLSSGTCWAVDNSIYIDQSGDNANIAITQDGAGNTVKGIVNNAPGVRGVDAATITGDNTQLQINQVGSGNTLSLQSAGSTESGKRNTTINYSVTGDNAQALIKNNGASNLIDITQSGNNSVLQSRVIGDRNEFTATTSGPGDSVISTITGNDNAQNITKSGTGGGNSSTIS